MPRLVSIGFASLLAFSVLAADKGDWPQWRGPDRDGISRETGLLDRWPEDGPKLAWKAEGLGRGLSSVSIADGRLFTLGRLKKGGTQLVAFDLSTHKVIWTAPVGGGDPNSTPTVDGDRVYALGRDGDLVCADTATGKVVWKKNFPKDFGGSMMSGWGYSESVLVDGDKLVCTPGAHKAMIVALDKKTGKTLWESTVPDKLGDRGKDGAGYSSVVVSKACGVKQYVQLTGRGVISVAADDGKFLWSYNKVANDTANIPTPIVKGDYVFASSGYGTGAALLKVEKRGDGLTAKEEYFLPANKMQNHHGGMVLVGDYVYCGHGHNEGFPLCVELKTGKVMWKPGRGAGQGSAAIVYADGNLYFRYQNGTMALVEATPKEYRLKGSFRLATVNGESWPHPVIAGGKLYIRDQDALLCYDIKK